MIESIVTSGNLSGSLVVSISNAKITGSGRCTRSGRFEISTVPSAFAFAMYQRPTRISIM